MSSDQTDIVMKKVISEIVQGCTVRGHAVSDTLVAFMVKAVVLDPRNGFNVDQTLTKQDFQKLGELCLDKLTEEFSLSCDTIKMQVYFDMNYTSRREFLEEVEQEVELRLSPLSREITDSRVKTREELDDLYAKIVLYVLLRSSMGSPTDAKTMQEAKVALQSIFPQTGLGAFMMLLKRDKEQQLNELTTIVTGIRLFNKSNKKGEEETDLHELVPAIAIEALPITSKSIENELNASQSLAWKYTAVLEKLTNTESLPGECDVPIVLIKQALYNVRQHEVFLNMLLGDACLCAKHVETLQTEFSSQMKLLKETVKTKTAIHTADVFPQFKALSKVWFGLRNEAELLNILNNIRLNLQTFITSQAKIYSEACMEDLLEAVEVKTDEQRMIESSDDCILPAEMKPQDWLLPETMGCFSKMLLQYNGACAYTLVNRDGLLLPGNPHIGILKHKDKFYVFSSKDAALKFATRLEYFIAEVEEKAKVSPELIHFLKIHQQLPCISLYSEVQPEENLLIKPITKSESCTQTDIHPVKTNNVKSYEWNEWELRRKAIKLADLTTKVTHSTQTYMSHLRQENVTQTWLPKNAACQSKRDGESSMPKPQVYLTGLRAQRDGPQWKTNVTRSIDE